MHENKSDKFKRLAESRAVEAHHVIGKIGKLSNTNNYSYTQQEYETIYFALTVALMEMRLKFINQGREPDEVFEL